MLHLHHDRLQQIRCLAHPIAEGGPTDLDPMPLEDPLQAVQGQVVCILAGQNMRYQAFPGPALLDRHGRKLCNDHPFLAGLTRVLDSYMLKDHKGGRHVLQLLGDLFADLLFGLTALTTGQVLRIRVMFDALPWQVSG
jgi:hypothetical protein